MMATIFNLENFYQNIKGHPVSAGQERGHFNIIKVEDMQVTYPKKLNYSRRSYYKVSLVNGHSIIHYADQSVEIKESTLVFTNPMIPYTWERISEQQQGFVCLFTEDFLNRFANIQGFPIFSNATNAIVPVNPDQAEAYNQRFLRMENELQAIYPYKYDLLRILLLELIHEAQKLQPLNGDATLGVNAHERITLHFLELLESQFPIESTDQRLKLDMPSAFANQLNVHINHLNKALKEITGNTTSRLIANRTIQEATILLKNSDWSVAEIAWSLGFDEPNNFSSFFRHHTQRSPKQFRTV